MRSPLSLFLLALVMPLASLADEPAEVVRTAGTGDLERVSNFFLFSSSTKTPVRIPTIVTAGDNIQIQYVESGKTVTEAFPVVDVAIRGDLCWLHSKRRTQYDTTLGNTIYVKPCAKVR